MALRIMGMLVALTALAAAGCADPVRDNPLDQKRCAIPCGKGEMCRDGVCVHDPCPDGLIHVKKQSSAGTDFCMSPVESSKKSGSTAANITSGHDPWVNLLPGEAWAACRAAGFTLCTQNQFTDACLGRNGDGKNDNSPDEENCKGKAFRLTGTNAGCEGGFTGLFDLLGNAAEWVTGGSQGSGKYPSGHGTMGGSYQNGQLDCYAGKSDWQIDENHMDKGFRCCVPCDATGKICKAKAGWFTYAIKGTFGTGTNHGGAADMWGSSPKDIWMVLNDSVAHYDGHSWAQDKDMDSIRTGARVTGVSKNLVWVAVGQTVHRYDGTNWSKLVPQNLSLNAIHDIYAVTHKSVTSVYVVADNDAKWNNTVFRWDDKDKDWKPVGKYIDAARGIWVNKDSGVVWVVGDEGKTARFEDGTWKAMITGAGDALMAIHGTADNNVWAVGSRGTGGDALVFRYTGGPKWEEQVIKNAPSGSNPTNVQVLDEKRVWISGARTGSRDSSGNWTWLSDQLASAVWVPEPSKPTLVWVGTVRYY